MLLTDVLHLVDVSGDTAYAVGIVAGGAPVMQSTWALVALQYTYIQLYICIHYTCNISKRHVSRDFLFSTPYCISDTDSDAAIALLVISNS